MDVDKMDTEQMIKLKDVVRARLEVPLKSLLALLQTIYSFTPSLDTIPALCTSLEGLLDHGTTITFRNFHQGLSAQLWEQLSAFRRLLASSKGAISFHSASYSSLLDLTSKVYEGNMFELRKLWCSSQPPPEKLAGHVFDGDIFVPVLGVDGSYNWEVMVCLSRDKTDSDDEHDDCYEPPCHSIDDCDPSFIPKYDLCCVIIDAMKAIADFDENILQTRCVEIIGEIYSHHKDSEKPVDRALVPRLIIEAGLFLFNSKKDKQTVVPRLTTDKNDGMIIRVLNTNAVKGPNSLEWSSYYSIAKRQSTDASFEYEIVYGDSCTGMTFSTAQEAVDTILDASFVDVKDGARGVLGLQGWGFAKRLRNKRRR